MANLDVAIMSRWIVRQNRRYDDVAFLYADSRKGQNRLQPASTLSAPAPSRHHVVEASRCRGITFVTPARAGYVCDDEEVNVAEEATTLGFLARLCQQTLSESRTLRRDLADVRTLSLQTIEYVRRVERRLTEQRDDLQLMIKAELGGSLANMQTRLEHHLQPLRDKFLDLDKLDARGSALESTG